MNCLFTLNIRNKQGWNTPFTTDRVRRSFIDACHRWGCNYAEINHDHDPDAKICNWGKVLGPSLLCGYDKLLYLDSDMIVSEHAPNPFDLCVKPDTMYAVADMQGVNLPMNPAWHDCIYLAGTDKLIERYPNLERPAPERYFNTGFMLFHNTRELRETFDMIDQCREFEAPTCYDQSVINVIVHSWMKVDLLPEAWNYIVWDRPPNPEAHINHFIQVGPSLQ